MEETFLEEQFGQYLKVAIMVVAKEVMMVVIKAEVVEVQHMLLLLAECYQVLDQIKVQY